MDASTRVNLIEAIADSLAERSIEKINLILQHHGYSGILPFGQQKTASIIKELKFSDEEKLIPLAHHLGLSVDDDPTDRPDFWDEGYYKIFISHLAADKLIAKELKESFLRYGITSFVAHEDIIPTREWQMEIETALKTCDCLVALMTEKFSKSDWTDQEIGYAYGRNKIIIPVRMGKDPYGFIGRYQAVSYTNESQLAEDIFSLLLNHHKSSLNMSNALMYKFENSHSFEEAKTTWRKLERIPHWTKELEKRFYAARESNYQIQRTYAVPTNIDYYVERSRERKNSVASE